MNRLNGSGAVDISAFDVCDRWATVASPGADDMSPVVDDLFRLVQPGLRLAAGEAISSLAGMKDVAP